MNNHEFIAGQAEKRGVGGAEHDQEAVPVGAVQGVVPVEAAHGVGAGRDDHHGVGMAVQGAEEGQAEQEDDEVVLGEATPAGAGQPNGVVDDQEMSSRSGSRQIARARRRGGKQGLVQLTIQGFILKFPNLAKGPATKLEFKNEKQKWLGDGHSGVDPKRERSRLTSFKPGED